MMHVINIIKNMFFKSPATNLSFNRQINTIPFMLCLLVGVSGCNDSNVNSHELALLESAIAKWESHSGRYYTIQSQRTCECGDEVSALMDVSVLDSSVLSAFNNISGEAISKETQVNVRTVEVLFDLIKEAIVDNVSIDVIYNAEYGYPETTKIDLEQIPSDGGLHINLSNLELQNSLFALDDVTWELESFDSVAGSESLIENTHISLSADLDNKKISGFGSCNTYSADFSIDETNHNISITNAIHTDMACSEPENIMEQEQDYFDTLIQVQFFTFDNTMLKMVIGGDTSLNYSPEIKAIDTTGSVSENPSNDLALLQKAKTKWESHSRQYYTIESQRFCECEDEASAQMNVSVLDNYVLSAFDVASGLAISEEIQKEISTVDTLFALIETAITDQISIDVDYNEEYGYPEMTKINLEQIPVDGGLYINLSNLEIKTPSLVLDDVTWLLESFDNIAGPQAVIENSDIKLSIDLDNYQINGVAGCNAYSADFVLDEETHDMTISNLISTEMFCNEPEKIMEQEQNYFNTLSTVRFFIINNATLNMVVGADAGLRFTAVKK